jgi:glutathione S-transferase
VLKIYGHPFSSNARKVHWALEELGLAYTYEVIDWMRGEHKQPDYLRINPLGRVPAIVDGDVTMFESNAILCYLEERYGHGTLLPRDAAPRAEVYEWMWWQASDLSRVMLEPFLARFFASMGMGPLDDARQRSLIGATAAPLDALETRLKGREFVAAGQFTLADIAIGESVSLAEGAGIGLGGRPHIKAWLARLAERPAFKKTRASAG